MPELREVGLPAEPVGEQQTVGAYFRAALWADDAHGTREIELGRGATAILLTAHVETKRVWTADGRCHADVPRLTLSATHDVRPDRAC